MAPTRDSLSLLLAALGLCALALLVLWWVRPPYSTPVEMGGTEIGGTVKSFERAQDLDERHAATGEPTTRTGASAGPEAVAEDGPLTILAGTLVSASGTPVSDAVVLCGPTGPAFIDFLNELERHGAQEVPGYRIARTDARGRFELQPDSLGTLRLSVIAPKLVQLDLDPVYASLGTVRDLGTLRLHEGVILAGSVVDARDDPVAGAEIHRFERIVSGRTVPATRVLAGRSDADGSFELRPVPPGSWLFQVEAEDHPELFVTGRSAAPGVELGHIFRLSRGFAIKGSVIVPDTEDPTAVVVRAQYRGDPREIRSTLTGTLDRRVLCDPEGRFVLTRLEGTPQTPYELTAGFSVAGIYWVLSDAVTAYPGDEDVRVALRPTARLEFRVEDGATGELVDDARIELFYPGGSRLLDPSAQAQETLSLLSTFRDRYRILRVPTRAPLLLAVSSPQHATTLVRDFSLRPGELTDLGTIILEAREPLRVRVLDGQTEEPIASATVYLHCSGGEPDPSLQGRGPSRTVYSPPLIRGLTNSEGIVVLPLPVECRSTIAADHPDYAPSAPLTVDPAAARAAGLELLLDRGGAAEILVVDPMEEPVPGVAVTRLPDSSLRKAYAGLFHLPLERTLTGPDGVARFSRLPPGVHRFELASLWKSELPPAETGTRESESQTLLTVSAGRTASARFVLGAGSRGRGIVTEAGVPLVGAELFLVDRRLKDIGLGQLASVDQSYGPLGRRPIAVSGHHGRFDLVFVRSGGWILEVHHPNRSLASQREVRVDRDGFEWAIDLPRTEVDGILVGPKEITRAFPLVHLGVAEARSKITASLAPRARWGKELGLAQGILAETTPDLEGRFRFVGAPVGVPLFAVAFGENGETVESASFTLDERALDAQILLEVHTGGSLIVEITGRRQDAVYLVGVHHAADAEDVRHEYADKQGLARFDHLRAGAWRVSVVAGLGVEPIVEGSVAVSGGERTRLVLHIP